VVANPTDFEPSQFFALGLLEFSEWPQELLVAHWFWDGSGSEEHPTVRVGKEIHTVRRVLYCLTANDPEPRKGVYFKVHCNAVGCVNPSHFHPEAKKGFTLNPDTPVYKEAVVEPNDLEDLAQELMGIVAMREPESFKELMSRDFVKEFTEDQVRAALKFAELPVPA